MYGRLKKGGTPFNNSNRNYRREMKLIPRNMDCILLQFDDIQFFLGYVSMGGRSLPNFSFFNVNTQILQRDRKIH